MDKVNLARKHVLSDSELSKSHATIFSIAGAAMDRIQILRGGSRAGSFPPKVDLALQIFSNSKTSKPRIGLRSLQRVWYVHLLSPSGDTKFAGPVQYKIGSVCQNIYSLDLPRDLHIQCSAKAARFQTRSPFPSLF